MSAAHTPGPWMKTAERSIVNADNTRIANVVRMEGVDFYEAEANARLIAAAPFLLSLLKAIVSASDGNTTDLRHRIESARAAIAKATGETA